MPNGYGAYDDSAGDDASYNNGDDSEGSDDAYDYDEETGQPLPFAWLMTYPNDDPRQPPRQPKVILRSLHANRRRMEFEIACLIGYWHRDHKRLSDPDAPTGSIFSPHDPGIEALLHQYTIALLLLPKNCPDDWTCDCNKIRARFNVPPPDHTQPTDVLDTDELIAEARRQRTDTEPRFPYPDPNRWTEE